MAEPTSVSTPSLLSKLLTAAQFEDKKPAAALMIQKGFSKSEENADPTARFVSGLAAVLHNIDTTSGRYEKGQVLDVVAQIDRMVNEQLNAVFHHPTFQSMEGQWRGIAGLIESTNFASNITIDLLDVSKEELHQDFDSNSTDVFSGSLFSKVYKTEYDQYGGRPYGCLLGLYDFATTPRDLFWLRNMSKVASASHAPFIAAVNPEFFGCKSIEEVEAIRDLDGVFAQPKMSSWMALRDTAEASYLGLTFPRYVARLPWDPERNPSPGLRFTEETNGDRRNYLWASSALLMARNLVRSFEQSGWCQYIRGPRGGGLIQGLPVDTFNVRGEDEIRMPVEICIQDFRELEFSRNGIMSLVYRKGSGDAAFFSATAIKLPKEFKDHKDSENSQLVANLSYTFSVSRVAHYIKSMVRDNIGDNSNEDTVGKLLNNWLAQYTTSQVTPGDLTMRRFPFKSSKAAVMAKPGRIGYYDCTVEILPHIQFEGLDVELRLESRLG